MKAGLLAIFTMAMVACSTTPYGHVQVGPGYPRGNCQEVGQVIGNANNRENAREQAMNDMRRNAARLEATYVRLVAVTAYGSAARGVAYRCQ